MNHLNSFQKYELYNNKFTQSCWYTDTNLLPAWGTNKKSPSALQKAESFIPLLATYLEKKQYFIYHWSKPNIPLDYNQRGNQKEIDLYMWIAKPWRRNELPAPHIVYNPSMKSVGDSGISSGLHLSWVGFVRLFDASNSLTSFFWAGTRGLNGSCVTDGLIRYNQLKKKP